MGKTPQILVDTDILIKVFRGNPEHRIVLEKEKGNLCISVVTYLELLFGVKTRRRVIDLHKQMKAYQVLHLSETISRKSLELLNKYAVSNSMRPPDALVAATTVVHELLLFTDNKQDFDFVKELKFYK